MQAAKDIDLNFHTQDQVTDHENSTIALNVGLAAFKDFSVLFQYQTYQQIGFSQPGALRQRQRQHRP